MAVFIFILVMALIATNAISFTMFAWDKWSAENGRRRVPESNLLFVSLIGGTIGAIAAQQILRHKTRKEPFRTVLWGIAAMQLVVLIVTATPPLRTRLILALGGAYRTSCVDSFIQSGGFPELWTCLSRA